GQGAERNYLYIEQRGENHPPDPARAAHPLRSRSASWALSDEENRPGTAALAGELHGSRDVLRAKSGAVEAAPPSGHGPGSSRVRRSRPAPRGLRGLDDRDTQLCEAEPGE